MFTVKNIKEFRGMEGVGFNADLYMDGKKIAFVIDDANGGPYNFEWLDYKAPRVNGEFLDWQGKPAERMMTPFEKSFNDFVKNYTSKELTENKLTPDMDIVIGDLVDAACTAKKFKRICKTKTMFRLKGDASGDYRVMNLLFTPAVKAKMVAKFGDTLEEIYNEKLV